MAETEIELAIRRKITAPVGPLEMPGNNLAKTMRLAFVRSIEKQIGLEIVVAGFCMEKMSLAQVAGGIGETDMIFMTQGPQGALGLVLLDANLVSGFLEQMITGRVVPGAGSERKPTKTDAAIMTDILAGIAKQFEGGLKQVSNDLPISGFRAANLLDDGRAVSLALEDVEYRTIHLALDMAQGAKVGNIRMVFPWDRVTPASAGATNANAWANDWEKVVKNTHVAIECVLLRLPMSLEQVSGWQIGDVIPVPVQAVGQIAITGRDGRKVGMGRLGQANGKRAIRIVAATSGHVGAAGMQPFPAPQVNIATPESVTAMAAALPMTEILSDSQEPVEALVPMDTLNEV